MLLLCVKDNINCQTHCKGGFACLFFEDNCTKPVKCSCVHVSTSQMRCICRNIYGIYVYYVDVIPLRMLGREPTGSVTISGAIKHDEYYNVFLASQAIQLMHSVISVVLLASPSKWIHYPKCKDICVHTCIYTSNVAYVAVPIVLLHGIPVHTVHIVTKCVLGLCNWAGFQRQ